MEQKTINIEVPEGFEIDTKESNLAEGKIVFKKKEEIAWRKRKKPIISGYYLNSFGEMRQVENVKWELGNHNTFATEKQVRSTLAMAYITQIMANDERFGGPITDEEWNDASTIKHVILRRGNKIDTDYWSTYYNFLAFHTRAQRDLFIKENMDLIKQYFMLD